MVMHARKYPRHSDGYYDRNQAHPFEDKYPSKSHSGGGGSGGSYYDRYGERSSSKDTGSSYARVRDDSPGRPSPRYQNKSSYKDRTKERVDKGPSSSPGERGLNHYSTRGEIERHSTSKPAFKSLESLKSTEPKDPKTEQIQKSALRVSGDWSEHRSSSGKKYYYNCTTEVSQWEKPKDWIELSANLGRPIESGSSSSSGRSKDRNGRDARSNSFSASSSKSSDDRYKHSSGGLGSVSSSSGNHRGSSGLYPPASSSSGGGYSHVPPADSHHHSHQLHHHQQHHSSRHSSTSSTPHRGGEPQVGHRDGEHRDRGDLRKAWSMPAERYAEYSSREVEHRGGHRSGEGQSSRDRDGRDRDGGLQRIPVVCRSSSLPDGPDGGPRGGSGSAARGGSQRSDERHHHSSTSSSRGSDHSGSRENHLHPHHHSAHHSHHHHHKMSAFNGTRHHGDPARNEDQADCRGTEDMDISPGSTPTSSRPNSHMGTPVPNNSMTPSLSAAAASQSMGNDLTQQAIQTLQKLQAALMAQQHQLQQVHTTSTTVNQSPRGQPDATPPHQPAYPSPHINNTGGQPTTPRPPLNQQLSQVEDESRESRESPRSDRSVRSSRRGSPTPSVASSQSVSLSGSSLSAANKKPDAVQLTPSLSNYYNDTLIEHCANLQADQAERQANRYGEEAHSVGTLHCTQVSVDLKRARSLVRIAEIQATLQEQRILFLRQQTRDLENMRSQNSFMPSQQDT